MNSAFWLCSSRCRHFVTIELGSTTVTSVSGSHGEPPDLLDASGP